MQKNLVWNQIQDYTPQKSTPCARWGHASFVLDQKFYIMGGYADSKYMNDLWEFDFNSNLWKKMIIGGILPQPRSNHSIVVNDDKEIYLFGGGGQSKARFCDVWLLDLKFYVWKLQKCSGLYPSERTYQSACIGKNCLFIYGGENGQDLDDLSILSLKNKKWLSTQIDQLHEKPQARRFATINYIESHDNIDNYFGRLVLIGGCQSNYTPYSSIYIANIIQNDDQDAMIVQWQMIKYTSLSLWGHATVQKNNHIWLCGGRADNKDVMDVIKISIIDQLKIEKQDARNIIAPRRKQSLSYLGDCLIVFGGFNGSYLDDFNYIDVQDELLNTQYQNFFEMMQQMYHDEKIKDFAFILNNNQIITIHKFILLSFLSHYKVNDQFIQKVIFYFLILYLIHTFNNKDKQ